MTKGLSPQLSKIIESYPAVFQNPPHASQIPNRIEDMKIEVKNEANVKQRPLGRLSDMERKALKEFITELLNSGKIRISNSSYGANILFAKKSDGGLRLVCDYRSLNAETVRDQTPLISHAVMRERIRGCKYISKLDIRDAFHSILVCEEDRAKTAFKTEFGLFEYTVCPFGLANSPATFIRLMNRVFAGTEAFVIHYVDDILIFSNSEKEHHRHIEEVLSRLQNHQLYVKLSKCIFEKTELSFCGVKVNSDGVQMDQEAIKAMCEYPQIDSFKAIQSFLGSVRFFAEFIPWLGDIAFPLFQLTKKEVVTTCQFKEEWTELHQMAVRAIQFHLTNSTTLNFFNPDYITTVHSDASDFAIGGWIGQKKDDSSIEQVVTYWSRQLIPAERNYPTHEKEFLAMYATIVKHRHHLFGHKFTAEVDHCALEHLATQPHLRPRQIRWILELQEFDFTTKYCTGESNTFADWLS